MYPLDQTLEWQPIWSRRGYFKHAHRTCGLSENLTWKRSKRNFTCFELATDQKRSAKKGLVLWPWPCLCAGSSLHISTLGLWCRLESLVCATFSGRCFSQCVSFSCEIVDSVCAISSTVWKESEEEEEEEIFRAEIESLSCTYWIFQHKICINGSKVCHKV